MHHLKYFAIPSDENETVTWQLKGQTSKIRYQVGGNSSFINICRQSTGFLRNKHRSYLFFGIPFCYRDCPYKDTQQYEGIKFLPDQFRIQLINAGLKKKWDMSAQKYTKI